MVRHAQQPALVEGDHLMKFDVVVANPPFSPRQVGRGGCGDDQFKRFWRGIRPSRRATMASSPT